MAYIDQDYYHEIYKGVPIDDVDTFNRHAERASDVVDQVTNYVLYGRDLERFSLFIQEQVKKATAAQVEYYVQKGYGVEGGGDFQQVRIGNFNYSKLQAQGLSRNQTRVSPALIEHLKPTGLLYRGVVFL